MALFLKQDFDSRSELQNKLAMELQERAKLKAKNADLPDGVNDSKYIEGTKNTTSLAWVWILILLSAFGIAIWLIVK
jgi:hypothetical protein